MAYLEPKKENGTGTIPVFQKVLETARGGFSLDKTGLTEGDILKAGTPIHFDENDRTAVVATLVTINEGEEDEAQVSNANGLLYDDVVIEEGAPIAAVVRGTCYKKRLPQSGNGIANWEDHQTALEPLIIFSESY